MLCAGFAGNYGAQQEVILAGTEFSRIMLGGTTAIILLFLINGIFRGAGDPMIAMKSLWLASLINIILCPLLIFGYGIFPELGLTGAAVATTIGRTAGVVYQTYHLFKGSGMLKIKENISRLTGRFRNQFSHSPGRQPCNFYTKR